MSIPLPLIGQWKRILQLLLTPDGRGFYARWNHGLYASRKCPFFSRLLGYFDAYGDKQYEDQGWDGLGI